MIILLAATLFSWFIWLSMFKFEIAMNGGDYTQVWINLKQDTIWAFSRKARGEWCRKRVDIFENGSMGSGDESWSYEEIRENNRYEEVGTAMLPGIGHFILFHCMLLVIIPCAVSISYCFFSF